MSRLFRAGLLPSLTAHVAAKMEVVSRLLLHSSRAVSSRAKSFGFALGNQGPGYLALNPQKTKQGRTAEVSAWHLASGFSEASRAPARTTTRTKTMNCACLEKGAKGSSDLRSNHSYNSGAPKDHGS